MDINLYIYIAKWSKRGIKSDVNGNENNQIGQTIQVKGYYKGNVLSERCTKGERIIQTDLVN